MLWFWHLNYGEFFVVNVAMIYPFLDLSFSAWKIRVFHGIPVVSRWLARLWLPLTSFLLKLSLKPHSDFPGNLQRTSCTIPSKYRYVMTQCKRSHNSISHSFKNTEREFTQPISYLEKTLWCDEIHMGIIPVPDISLKTPENLCSKISHLWFCSLWILVLSLIF